VVTAAVNDLYIALPLKDIAEIDQGCFRCVLAHRNENFKIAFVADFESIAVDCLE
jgi:hypothetical protein